MSVSESGSKVLQSQEKMLVFLLFDDDEVKESDMLKLLSLILTLSRCLIMSGQTLEDDQPALRRLQWISHALHKMRCLDVPTRSTLQIVAALGLPRPKPSIQARKSIQFPDGTFPGPRGGSAISHPGILWLRHYESERMDQLSPLINEDILSGLLELHITPTDVTFYGQQAKYRKSVSRLNIHPTQADPSYLVRPGDEPGDVINSQPSYSMLTSQP